MYNFHLSLIDQNVVLEIMGVSSKMARYDPVLQLYFSLLTALQTRLSYIDFTVCDIILETQEHEWLQSIKAECTMRRKAGINQYIPLF